MVINTQNVEEQQHLGPFLNVHNNSNNNNITSDSSLPSSTTNNNIILPPFFKYKKWILSTEIIIDLCIIIYNLMLACLMLIGGVDEQTQSNIHYNHNHNHNYHYHLYNDHQKSESNNNNKNPLQNIIWFGMLTMLQSLFLYGIIHESICLSLTYAIFAVIDIVIRIFAANDVDLDDVVHYDQDQNSLLPLSSSSKTASLSLFMECLWWINMIWIVATTAIAFMYMIDLLKLQRMKQQLQKHQLHDRDD